MRGIRTSGSTRGQWIADPPSPTVLLYRPSAAIFFPSFPYSVTIIGVAP
jgi:hypothetical protein